MDEKKKMLPELVKEYEFRVLESEDCAAQMDSLRESLQKIRTSIIRATNGKRSLVAMENGRSAIVSRSHLSSDGISVSYFGADGVEEYRPLGG